MDWSSALNKEKGLIHTRTGFSVAIIKIWAVGERNVPRTKPLTKEKKKFPPQLKKYPQLCFRFRQQPHKLSAEQPGYSKAAGSRGTQAAPRCWPRWAPRDSCHQPVSWRWLEETREQKRPRARQLKAPNSHFCHFHKDFLPHGHKSMACLEPWSLLQPRRRRWTGTYSVCDLFEPSWGAGPLTASGLGL